MGAAGKARITIVSSVSRRINPPAQGARRRTRGAGDGRSGRRSADRSERFAPCALRSARAAASYLGGSSGGWEVTSTRTVAQRVKVARVLIGVDPSWRAQNSRAKAGGRERAVRLLLLYYWRHPPEALYRFCGERQRTFEFLGFGP